MPKPQGVCRKSLSLPRLFPRRGAKTSTIFEYQKMSNTEIETQPARRRGRPSKGDLKRIINVSSRLSSDEASSLDNARGRISRGEFLRMAFQNKIPAKIPKINKLAWLELSRTAGNLNQAMKIYNAKPGGHLDLLDTTLHDFRDALIGVTFDNQDNDEDEDEDD